MSMAKPSALQSILMSTLGVIITATLTGLFSHIVLKITLLEGLLIGAVVASTDAASVFATLRSQKLNLKCSLAPLLEVESGSNDPVAYMATLQYYYLCNKRNIYVISYGNKTNCIWIISWDITSKVYYIFYKKFKV